ncbi:MAG: bifunctional methylenetetrahydrofolate dehydrogenase/methenyltetrahydrofolate cyclohydrolase FolD [Gammaproteobacteria bacterium]|nr:bifunctional methylenetetrahydrofolate dehydrogenase/methenyltetrahydrofolate cyclohydrolase FolD [Gammaproteobacteria bacterium]
MNNKDYKILDGKAIAQEIKDNIKKVVTERLQAGKSAPGLDVILVGDNPASASYVSHKQRACDYTGIRSRIHQLPEDTTMEAIAEQIDACNADPEVNGILLQLPLPEKLQPESLLERINPAKDVDGFHPYNLGRLVQRRPLLRPCTPYGVITLLEHTDEDLAGKHVVIIGSSNIVGRPMALECLLQKCTVTVCHRFTKDLASEVQQGDIVIAAIGKPGIIQSDWIKPGAIVIDVGFSRLSNGAISGDIDFETAKHRASWITPVPGGVGPMTVATLLENTVLATKLQDAVNSA